MAQCVLTGIIRHIFGYFAVRARYRQQHLCGKVEKAPGVSLGRFLAISAMRFRLSKGELPFPFERQREGWTLPACCAPHLHGLGNSPHWMGNECNQWADGSPFFVGGVQVLLARFLQPFCLKYRQTVVFGVIRCNSVVVFKQNENEAETEGAATLSSCPWAPLAF